MFSPVRNFSNFSTEVGNPCIYALTDNRDTPPLIALTRVRFLVEQLLSYPCESSGREARGERREMTRVVDRKAGKGEGGSTRVPGYSVPYRVPVPVPVPVPVRRTI